MSLKLNKVLNFFHQESPVPYQPHNVTGVKENLLFKEAVIFPLLRSARVGVFLQATFIFFLKSPRIALRGAIECYIFTPEDIWFIQR